MIHVDHLVKEYRVPIQKKKCFSMARNLFSAEHRTIRAVNDISFNVQKGEVVGYIGKNGAGKSTTIKVLAGVLQPTSGNVIVNGINPSKKRIANARQIGVVFGQKTQLCWDVPLIESYRLLREIYDIDPATFEKNLKAYTSMLELDHILDKPVRQMSLGQRVKSDIAAALLHAPPILFLDEPTIGVDIVSKKFLHDFILKINREHKTTILLTTHDLGDIETLCSRVMIIGEGRLMYEGTIQEMKQKYGTTRMLVVEFEDDIGEFNVPKAKLVKREAKRYWYKIKRYEATPSELIQVISSQHPIIDLQVIEPDVENIVRNLYEKKREE